MGKIATLLGRSSGGFTGSGYIWASPHLKCGKHLKVRLSKFSTEVFSDELGSIRLEK